MTCDDCGATLRDASRVCIQCGWYRRGVPVTSAFAVAGTGVPPGLRAYGGFLGGLEFEPAGHFRRLLANLLDSALLFALLVAGSAMIAFVAGDAGARGMIDALGRFWWLFLLFELAYWSVFEASYLRATPGKLLVGLAVTDEDGETLGLLHTITRAVAKSLMLGVVPFTVFVALFTAKRQTLYDLLLGTRVIED